jgi:hypothetical protein
MAFVYALPVKAIHGDNLLAECIAAGLPVTDIFVSDQIRFVCSRELSESEQELLAAEHAAHVAPAPMTHRNAVRARAKVAFTDTLDPIATASRNADRALFRSLRQTREKINEVITWINANGGSISPLTNRSFAQAMQGAAALVDAETDPTGD